jgi:hypothetical protein
MGMLQLVQRDETVFGPINEVPGCLKNGRQQQTDIRFIVNQ